MWARGRGRGGRAGGGARAGAGAGGAARGRMAGAARAAGPGFSACFDSGNGVLGSNTPGGSGGAAHTLRVAISDDPFTEVDGRAHKMWFHFKVSNLQGCGGPVRVVLTNAGDCSYPAGWEGVGAEGYKCVFSTDRQNWQRLQATEYADGELAMTLDASAGGQLAGADAVWLAYFAPYSQERYMDLMGGLVASCPRAATATIGQTLDGADMEMVTVRGGPDTNTDKLSLWFIARQHPGESMASWWMEGFLRRLLDPADPVSTALLALADIRVVPMMNPDGARRGYLRTNAAGANLNREWAGPTEDYSPEVFHVLREMRLAGLDFCLDVHGDEALPYNFVAGGEGCPVWSPRLEGLQQDWSDAYQRASPDFQQVHGYEKEEPGKANLRVCSNALLQAFDALVMTLEMPFKDNANSPDPALGWSPARCDRLGAAALDATLHVAHRLR